MRAARGARGASLREVARQVDVSPSFVSQVELGKASPSVGTLYALVSVLGISLDERLSGAADQPAGSGARSSSTRPLRPRRRLTRHLAAHRRPRPAGGGPQEGRDVGRGLGAAHGRRPARRLPARGVRSRVRVLPAGGDGAARRARVRRIFTGGSRSRWGSRPTRSGRRRGPLRLDDSPPPQQPVRGALHRRLVRAGAAGRRSGRAHGHPLGLGPPSRTPLGQTVKGSSQDWAGGTQPAPGVPRLHR